MAAQRGRVSLPRGPVTLDQRIPNLPSQHASTPTWSAGARGNRCSPRRLCYKLAPAHHYLVEVVVGVAEFGTTRYLSLADVLALHAAVMEQTGYAPAPLRDEGLLDSAIQRPRTAAYHEEADLIRQAALLAVGISQI